MSLDKVAGECPMGCGRTLFLGNGGHVTCSLLGCPAPCAVDELLHAQRIERIERIETILIAGRRRYMWSTADEGTAS
jgi:hypothetical protein